MDEVKFQIGKSGLTEGIIESLALAFKKHKQVRISVLKSCLRDKNQLVFLSEELLEKLKSKTSYNYISKIIGYTLIIKRKGLPNSKKA